jgi:hypothetical protein
LPPGGPFSVAVDNDYFTNGQILESQRVMGSGKHERQRRVVYQWSFTRSKRDDKAINAQIARAEKIAAGKAPLARTRFLKVTGATKELNQATIDRARQLAATSRRSCNRLVTDNSGPAAERPPALPVADSQTLGPISTCSAQ